MHVELDEHGIETIASNFEAQVARTPDHPALVSADRSMTYAELNRAANLLAHALIAQLGADGAAVALLLEHGTDAVVGLLGAVKANKFFVPLDLNLPDARLAFILQDSGARLIVTNLQNQARAVELAGTRIVLTLEELPQDAPNGENPNLPVAPDALLNLMYTSGSTGEPKGVIQLQRNVVYSTHSTNVPPHSSGEHIAQVTPFTFGASSASVLRALSSGAELFLFDLKRHGLAAFSQFLNENKITRFHTVPSVLRSWLAAVPEGMTFPHVRTIGLGGEPFYLRDVEKLKRFMSPECVVRVVYASTETYNATWNFVSLADEIHERIIPVGKAVPGREILILDENRAPVPVGEIGEIYVKGRFLSPGYWHRPDLTAATFLADEQDPQATLYKSGDLGRLRADGTLEHLGRRDAVVKVNGRKVPLTGVETAVRGVPGIKDAAVIAQPNALGDPRVVAYVVGDARPPDVTALRAALSAELPAYMVPAAFVYLDALPMLPSGKLDRRALPNAASDRPALASAYVAPRTPLEIKLAEIWCDVLGFDRVGIHDSFIELGGNSLQAAQVVARASQWSGVEVPLSAVFDVPDIEGMAQVITRRLAEQVQAQELERLLAEVEQLSDASAYPARSDPPPSM